MTWHGHRRLAWLSQGIDVGFVGHTVVGQLPNGSDPVVMGLPIVTGLSFIRWTLRRFGWRVALLEW
jgi:hypothetical protein